MLFSSKKEYPSQSIVTSGKDVLSPRDYGKLAVLIGIRKDAFDAFIDQLEKHQDEGVRTFV